MSDKKFISCKVVLNDVRRDGYLSNSNWRWDALEWITAGIEEIGCSANIITVTQKFMVNDHRLRLPCNFKLLERVIYNNVVLDKIPVVNFNELDEDNIKPFYTWSGDQPNYIFFSFLTGEIQLYWKTVAVEETNDARYPLIPDDINVRNALFWKVMYHYLLRGGTHQTIKDWREAYKMWMDLKPKAQNSLLMLKPQDMEEIANGLIDLRFDNDKIQKQFFSSPVDRSSNNTIEYADGETSVIAGEYIPTQVFTRLP